MAEYVDYAEYYDYEHHFLDDLEFYLGYAHRCGSPILELACGTGRLLIPLAKAGFQMVGLDFSPNMLLHCQRKVEENNLSNRVHLMMANMAHFDLPRKDFALAFIPVRSFMHLFTQADQLSCLQRVHDHLRPGGYLIVDVYAPDFTKLAQVSEEPFAVRREFDLPDGHHVIRKDRFVQHDVARQIMHYEIRFEEYDVAGSLVRQRTVPMDTRYTFRYELQLLLERTGFEIVDVFRDYDKSPYDGTGEIIAVARRQ